MRRAALAQEARDRRDEGRDGALHVGGAAAIDMAVGDRGAERLDGPAPGVADRHDVGVAGEAEIGRRVAEARIEVVDALGAVAERQAVTGEAERPECGLQHVERALVPRRHARAADQRAGQVDRVDRGAHSRSSSLIEVLARVLASTRLTMTAQ